MKEESSSKEALNSDILCKHGDSDRDFLYNLKEGQFVPHGLHHNG